MSEPQQKKRCRCAIYARVSTDEQNRGGFTSIKSQILSCENFIKAHKDDEISWEWTTTFQDVATGANLNRPGFQNLQASARAGKFDRLVIYKIDRLSRSLADFHDFWREFEEKIELSCVTQSIDTSDGAGRFFLNILLSFSQFEREINGQRVRDKRDQALKAGFWQGGWIPHGFVTKRSSKFDRDILVSDPKEAECVRKIYHLFLQSGSQSHVADQINSEGYRTKIRHQKTKDGKPKVVGGKRFDEDGITNILKNRIYIGEVWNERLKMAYDGKHEAIICDKGMWLKVQEMLTEKSVKHSRKIKEERNKYTFLLKGLVHCSHCGTTMTTDFSGKPSKEGKEPYLYYTCTKVDELGKHSDCTIRSVPARSMEKLVIEATQELAKHPALVSEVLKVASVKFQKDLGPLEKELSKKTARLASIDSELDQYLEVAKSRKGALADRAEKRIKELEQDKEVLDGDVVLLRQKVEALKGKQLDAEIVQKSFSQFAEFIGKMSLETQAIYCRLLIDRIDLFPWDPTQKKSPPRKSQEGLLQPDLALQTRTRWYRLKIRYRELPDFPAPSDSGKSSSGSHLIGSGCWTRTNDLAVTI